MRNLKKLLAVVVAICVLATFTVPAFAETKTDAQIATDLGVIKGAGTGVTAEYLATTPDRLQGAIMFLRLKGLEDTAKAFVGTDNFADVEGLNDTNQAILAYLKANPDLGFAGVGENKFSPLTKMTAKEYTKVMLVALGYVYETDFTWANVLSFAAGKGLVKNVDKVDTFTVNDLCVATVEALGTVVKGGTDKLIAKLVDGGSITSATAVASGLYTATPKALEIVSATSDTLKTAKFVFNQELDSTTVKVGNFTGVTLSDVKLLDDKKTVIVVLATAETKQSEDEDITVKNVKSAAGQQIAETKKTVVFVDTTIPVVSGVVAKNPKTLVISASEPMALDVPYERTISEIKIDGASKIAKSTVDFAKNTLTVILTDGLTTGTHKVEISGLKDYAAYAAVTQTYNVDVAEDKTAPSIVSAKMNTNSEIEVTFNEELSDLGEFDVDGKDVTAALSADKLKATLTLGTELGIGATVQIKVTYKNQKDIMGNKVEAATDYIFKVTDDTALPTATAAIGTDNKITITFSKAMYTTAGYIKILNADDSDKQLKRIDIAAGLFKADTNYTVIELSKTANGLDGLGAKNIKVVLTDMKDGTVRTNGLAATTIALKSYDAEKPVISDYFKVTDDTDDYVTFNFGEAMDLDSVRNLSNYTLSGATTNGALSTIKDAAIKEVASDGKVVKIKIPDIYLSREAAAFYIQAVKDANGNMADAKTVTWVGRAGVVAFDINVATTAAIKATAQDTLKVIFTQQVGSIDPDVFYVKTTGGAIKTTFKSVSLDSTRKIATFKTSTNMGTTVTSLQLYVNHKEAAKDTYETELAQSNGNYFAIVDGIKPEVDSIDKGTSNGSIIVKFTEPVEVTTFVGTASQTLFSDMIVRDKDGNKVVPADANVKFYLAGVEVETLATLAAGDDFDKIIIEGLNAGEAYSVEAVGSVIYDTVTPANVLAPKAKTTVTTENK